MSNIEWKEPIEIGDVTQTKNFVNATGQFKKTRFRGETYDFYQVRQLPSGNTMYEFVADLMMDNNQIRAKATSTKNKPTLAMDLANQFSEDDYVKISGFLNEYVKDEIPRRSLKINKIEKLNGKPESLKITSVLQGCIAGFDIQGKKLVLKIALPKFGKDGEFEVYETWGVTDDVAIQWLINKGAAVGDYVWIDATPVYKNYKDDNNEWVTKSYSLIKEVKGFAKGGKIQEKKPSVDEEFGDLGAMSASKEEKKSSFYGISDDDLPF